LPQVLIDVTLVEVSKADAFDYDLNIIESFPDLVSTSGLTGAVMPVVGEGASLVSKLLESGRDRFFVQCRQPQGNPGIRKRVPVQVKPYTEVFHESVGSIQRAHIIPARYRN